MKVLFLFVYLLQSFGVIKLVRLCKYVFSKGGSIIWDEEITEVFTFFVTSVFILVLPFLLFYNSNKALIWLAFIAAVLTYFAYDWFEAYLSKKDDLNTIAVENDFSPKLDTNKIEESILKGSCAIESKPESELKVKKHEYDSFDYNNYDDGHTEDEWKEIGFSVKSRHGSGYRRSYRFDEVKVGSSNKYPHLTPNQRKVKILGDALVYRTGSKYLAKEILVNQYGFKENTAKYAAGYDGFYDW